MRDTHLRMCTYTWILVKPCIDFSQYIFHLAFKNRFNEKNCQLSESGLNSIFEMLKKYIDASRVNF